MKFLYKTYINSTKHVEYGMTQSISYYSCYFASNCYHLWRRLSQAYYRSKRDIDKNNKLCLSCLFSDNNISKFWELIIAQKLQINGSLLNCLFLLEFDSHEKCLSLFGIHFPNKLANKKKCMLLNSPGIMINRLF